MSAEPRHFEPSADRTADLRRAFGCFGTGVTVVTVQTDAGPLGMTANSFSSVSLTPPLVLWSPALSSARHDAFARAATFCIHVLSDRQLEMARHFAQTGDGFDQFDWTPGPLGAPRLAGCLAEFHCSTHAIHPAGDHSLILGEVQHVIEGRLDASGLLFDRGRFGRFSDDVSG
ncbi:flavin reductase family protein [Roseobacter sinensis]|uniref:Flavin reductase family protein n=1 Tax=Roseobacter sinensis TaxID=2931391 RepID=A0ABT3BK68_9RHOB|nr:flavin reductase family protein [Roseobacter sp. WL0113]MCV3273972.1 flavin reductase family protein [Roseobacter sp. WL0113]